MRKVFSHLSVFQFSSYINSCLVLVIQMSDLRTFLDQQFAHFEVIFPGRVVERSLVSNFVTVVDSFCIFNSNTFGGVFFDYFQFVLTGRIKERSLAVLIRIIQIQPMAQQQLRTFLFSLPTSIEKDSLIHAIFVVDTSSIPDQQLDHVLRNLISLSQNSKIKRRLHISR